MNRRKTTRTSLGMGTVILLVASMVVMGGAGVFHAYVKNRQINVAREIQVVEERISQHKLDITNLEVRLDDQLNPILINDRLADMSSDLRRIPPSVVKEISFATESGSESARGAVPSRPASAGDLSLSAVTSKP